MSYPHDSEGKNVLRVLIVENQLLLGAGLQNLLSGETDLDVIGISPRNQLELVQKIRQIQPDVVFLDKDSRLTNATDLLTFLENFSKLRVIVVNANDNLAHIYIKKQILATPTAQLISIVRDS